MPGYKRLVWLYGVWHRRCINALTFLFWFCYTVLNQPTFGMDGSVLQQELPLQISSSRMGQRVSGYKMHFLGFYSMDCGYIQCRLLGYWVVIITWIEGKVFACSVKWCPLVSVLSKLNRLIIIMKHFVGRTCLVLIDSMVFQFL